MNVLIGRGSILEDTDMAARLALPALIPLVSILGACANSAEEARTPTAPAYLEKEYAALRARLRECTARTGFGPEAQQALGPYQLGRGELAWRECAYSAVRLTIVPATTHPELYLALIEKDKALTLGIRQKRITRQERAAQIAGQRERIFLHEANASDRMLSGLTEGERATRRSFLMESTRDLLSDLATRPRPPMQ